MTLELIIFIGSILFGALLYWRESHSNKLYRFFNKLMYSKALQMQPSDKTGFLYQQKFIVRLVFIGFLFLIGIVVTRFLIPIDVATLSIFASMIVGTVLGTYLAGFIFKSSEIIDKKSESVEDLVQGTIEKGKDFIEDMATKKPPVIEEAKKEIDNKPKSEEKSARERLKDKGLL
ncbi:hypothetical protein SAMN05421824_1762 [Hyunsoonleella jejuensis]|uniref:Uncharacterized protein n=1 Tax=Hyunsoonleella jejuensis TaxID=419940 RepID=A0A1H9GE74_9FLAO|nr:hypothetical protein [Hyunsoonleella jejuensis]SEQ48088.1 hypothetical protein SAMN05421824_1762 [Hyunsoonleella jejuensis]